MNTSLPSPSSRARRDIQGLRALAVLAVVGAHAFGWPRGGFVGVDVFFVVSGFLITGLLLRELDAHGRVDLRAFYARRARRILPAAVTVLALVAASAYVVFNRVRAEQTLWDAIWSAVFTANWHFAAEGTDYFHATDAVSPLQHFWSLSVEEQFYVVWPGLLLALVLLVPAAARTRRRLAWVVGAAAGVIVIASFAWALMQTGSQPTVAYFSTLTRVWELAAGAVLAAAAPLLARIPRGIGATMGWVGLGGIVWSFAVIDPEATAFPAPWAALPVAAAALVIAGGVAGDPRQRHLFPLTNPVSVFVGDMSYSLYLWHFPVIVFAAVLLPDGDVSTWLMLGSIAVLSLTSYLVVEQPLRYAPFFGGRTPATHAPDESAPATTPVTDAPPVVAPAPRAAIVSTRPAGWAPGTARYYPGSPRPLPVAAIEPADTPVLADPDPDPVVPPRAVAPAEATTSGAIPADSAWAAWRARFGSQVALTGAGVAIAALAVVLVVQSTFGGPTLGPLVSTAPDAGDTPDPTPALQSQLADAAGATQWPSLHPSLDEVIARSSATNPARDCFSPDSTPDAGRCSTGSQDAPTHIYLVGDSTAMAYAPAFRKMADDSGGAIRVTTVGLYGCRFTDLPVQNDGAGVMDACPGRKADVRAMIVADAPSLVVMSNAYTLGHTPGGANLSAAALISSQQAEAATYGLPGRIVYLAPPPEGADLGRCYSPVTSPYDCAVSVSPTWQQMETAAEQAAASTGDHAISSLPFSCWEGVCPAFAGEIPTKYDQTHLTTAYSERIAPVLRWDLAALGLI